MKFQLLCIKCFEKPLLYKCLRNIFSKLNSVISPEGNQFRFITSLKPMCCLMANATQPQGFECNVSIIQLKQNQTFCQLFLKCLLKKISSNTNTATGCHCSYYLGVLQVEYMALRERNIQSYREF